ncbi:MAG: 4-phospho-D-threonate 3-dehydrogenase, partial [Vulcanimicrobiaceae bacterium]
MGDAAGVGPEVIAKALADSSLYARARPLVIGDAGIMARAVALVGST